MWPFNRRVPNEMIRAYIEDTSVIVEPKNYNPHDLTEAGNSRQTFGTDLAENMQQIADTIATETPRETINVADKDTVEFHVANIRGILESVASRRQSLTESRQLRRDQFEADDNADADKIIELDRLTAVYQGALKIAAPGGSDGYGTARKPTPVDPEKMAEIGKRIAETRLGSAEIDTDQRCTFTIPDGFEAVRDAEGKATGEVRPIAPKPTRPRRRAKPIIPAPDNL